MIIQTQRSIPIPQNPHLFLRHTTHLLLLRPKPRRPNIAPSQLNPQRLLHRRQDLLVGGRGAALEIRDDALRRVALGRQVLLRHLGLDLLAPLRDDAADLLADRVGLDDVVAAVYLG